MKKIIKYRKITALSCKKKVLKLFFIYIRLQLEKELFNLIKSTKNCELKNI